MSVRKEKIRSYLHRQKTTGHRHYDRQDKYGTPLRTKRSHLREILRDEEFGICLYPQKDRRQGRGRRPRAGHFHAAAGIPGSDLCGNRAEFHLQDSGKSGSGLVPQTCTLGKGHEIFRVMQSEGLGPDRRDCPSGRDSGDRTEVHQENGKKERRDIPLIYTQRENEQGDIRYAEPEQKDSGEPHFRGEEDSPRGTQGGRRIGIVPETVHPHCRKA